MSSTTDRVVRTLMERATARGEVIPSRQPQSVEADGLFTSLARWVDDANLVEPPYVHDTRRRDQWLDTFWKREPFMAGVISQVVSLKKNQGYSITGGRNQVLKYSLMFKNANGGKGWRNYAGKQARAYYTGDLGAPSEIARQGKYPDVDQNKLALLMAAYPYNERARAELLRMNQEIADMPFGGLYHIDHTHVHLTGNPYAPLEMNFDGGGASRWLATEFFLCNSLPDARSDMQDVGFCALSRVLALAQIMVAIIRHDKEQLSAAAPAGFLALSGLSKQQWEKAMLERKRDRENQGLLYMRDLMVLASKDSTVEAKIISLSNLPDNFKLADWMEVYAQIVAGGFGFDLREFWTVKGGTLGVNGEAIVQADKTTGKGEADFTTEHAEQIQRLLPDTVEFAYDNRNDSGDLARFEAQRAYVDMLLTIYKETKDAELPILTTEQMQRMFVLAGIIDPDVIAPDGEDQGVATDTEKQRVRDSDAIRRAAMLYPRQPIIRAYSDDRIKVLWESGSELLRPRIWRGAKFKKGGITIEDSDLEEVVTVSRRVDSKLALLLTAGEVES